MFRIVAVLFVAAFATLAQAQPKDWSGQRIMVRQPGVKIGHTDTKGNQIFVAELTGMAYTVIADKEGWIKVAHREAEGWFDKAQALLVEDAVKFWKNRVAQTPRDANALAYYGWALRENAETKESIKVYDQVIAIAPTPDWLNNRGLIHLEMKSYDKAIADFTEAIKKAPKFLVPYENRASIHAERKEWDKAIADFSELIKLDAKYTDAYRKRAQAYVAKGQLEKALPDLDVAIEREPKHLPTRIYRGSVRLDSGKYEQAIEDLTVALAIQANEPNALVQRAHAYEGLKKYKEAITDLDEAIRLQPKTAAPRASRGFIRFLTKDYEGAVGDFQAAIKIDAQDATALNGYAWLLATSPDEKYRDGKKAVELAKQACDITKYKESGCIDTYAAAQAEAGNFDEAVRLQGQAIELANFEGDELAEARRRLDNYKKKMPHRQP
ncbi:MAG: tetratricopeptide repeat protein [Gemmataceae bacterium]|nr:tetratricopeptide repeat protein [Gemmataceae bacterium]